MTRRNAFITLGAIVLLAFTAMIVTVTVTVGIWPGELKLLAPVFCTDAQPDAFVVSDTTNVQPGETTVNFTLYCMGERGDYTSHGWFGPFILAMGIHAVIIVAVVACFWFLGRLRWVARRLVRGREPERIPGF
jgi:hypothetical protein